MQRSTINALMRDALEFMESHSFRLPPFAFWSPETWRSKGPEVREIVENGLGWDVTDFGSGDYERVGLFLFTLRNGHPRNWATLLENPAGNPGKLYAEKIMVVGVGQVTPMHFHWAKSEDIINRGGGNLLVRLYNATDDERLAETDVTVSIDGTLRTVPAGGIVTLTPGESITIPQRLYHTFWGEGSRVLVGEVSLVNDDTRDNRFYEPVGRFPEIEEDEPPLYLLAMDYPGYYR